MSKYINLVDPTKEQLSMKIAEGYQPFSITKKFETITKSGGVKTYKEVPVVTMIKANPAKKVEEMIFTQSPEEFEDYTLFASISLSDIFVRYQNIHSIDSEMIFVMVKRAKVEKEETQ